MAITSTIIPQEALLAKQDVIFSGATVTVHLTNGLVYASTVTVANVTAASQASGTAVGGAATWNASLLRAETPQIVVAITNGTGAAITYDGQATVVTIGGTARVVSCGNHDVAQTLPAGELRNFTANDSTKKV